LSFRAAHTLLATFDVVDDLLWQAREGRLKGRGQLVIERSGRIGPLVELAFAATALPAAYTGVTKAPPFFTQVCESISQSRITGAGARDASGVFPLVHYDPEADANVLWDQWASHVENAAAANGLARGLVAGLMGALGELQENVIQHSGRRQSGVVAYAAGKGAFEFVVADAGIGVLASLRQNSEFAGLADAGEALRAAASDGASRHARSTGRGYGIGRLFRSLAHDAGDLRFRSGDHVMRISGDAPSLTGQVEIAQKAVLGGFIVTVRCAPRRP